MSHIFDSIYSAAINPEQFFAMTGVTLLAGVMYSLVMSFCIRSTRRFFIVISIIPFIVGAVITFVNGNIGAGVAVGGAFSLIRFRSAPGSSDEIAALLITMGSGIAFGMGYLTYGSVILLVLSVTYFILSRARIFDRSDAIKEQLLVISVPETLEYTDAFRDIFEQYLSRVENVGVKTASMGAIFKLSFCITMKDTGKEKEMIDAIRTRNGNLEISVLPYYEQNSQL
ncbi:MAG: DUF4956 domain-containing protein [Blautia sp.]|nr:DUF4956 domain-containing protein [Blautia sp.]